RQPIDFDRKVALQFVNEILRQIGVRTLVIGVDTDRLLHAHSLLSPARDSYPILLQPGSICHSRARVRRARGIPKSAPTSRSAISPQTRAPRLSFPRVAAARGIPKSRTNQPLRNLTANPRPTVEIRASCSRPDRERTAPIRWAQREGPYSPVTK